MIGRFFTAVSMAVLVLPSLAVAQSVPAAVQTVPPPPVPPSQAVHAEARAGEARSNMEALEAEGTPESNKDDIVTMLDLYTVLGLVHDGKIDDARRNFAARSQWNTGQGLVMAVMAVLRPGARPDQLFGALAQTPDALWEGNRAKALAVRVQWQGNNHTLFSYILPYAEIGDYEALSKSVWRTDRETGGITMSPQPVKDSILPDPHQGRGHDPARRGDFARRAGGQGAGLQGLHPLYGRQ